MICSPEGCEKLLSTGSPAIEQVAAPSHVYVCGMAVMLMAFLTHYLPARILWEHLHMIWVDIEPAGDLCNCTTPACSA